MGGVYKLLFFTPPHPKLTMMNSASYFHDASSGGDIFRKISKYLSQDPTLLGKLFNKMFILVN